MTKKPAPQFQWDDKSVYRVAAGVGGLGLLIIALAFFFSGAKQATVTGRITYQGKPVIWGSVVLVGPDGRCAAGRIEPDGTFRVDNASMGAVSVGVISRDPLVQNWATNLKSSRSRPTNKLFAAPPPVDRQRWFPLPQHYEEPTNSGVTLILKSGTNESDITLR